MRLSRSACIFAARSLYPQALEQFQQAAKITDALGADHLSTEIRESIVQILATQGNTSASTAVLQQIETQLAAQGASDDLADNLLQQGRLLIKAYHYPLAINVLTRALQHETDHLSGKFYVDRISLIKRLKMYSNALFETRFEQE